MSARLDHAGVNVPDVDAAVAFLAAAFDAEVVFRMGPFGDPSGAAMRRIGAGGPELLEIAMLRIGDGCVELLGWSGPTRQPTWPAPGDLDSAAPLAGHLSVEVADVAGTLERLGAMPGVLVLGGPVTFTEGPTPGLTNAFVRTPWGLLVELVSWPGTDPA